MSRRLRHTPGLLKKCRCRPSQWDTCEHAWHLQFKPEDGTRERFSLTALYSLKVPMSRAEIEPWAVKAKNAISEGEIRNGEFVAVLADVRMTLGDVADRYVAARTDKDKDYYIVALRSSEVPAARGTTVKLEAKAIDDVTTADIEYAVDQWEHRPKAQKGRKSGAVARRKFLQAGRQLFNWAIKKGHATRTPFRREGVAVIEVKASKGRSRRLRQGEEERLLAAADPYTKDLITVALETGCRGGELRSLLWSDVGEDTFIVRAENAKDGELRVIPITPSVRRILDQRKTGLDGRELGPNAHVFGNEIGEPISRRIANEWWRATCKAAKVDDLMFHDLRREFGSTLKDLGVPIHDVRDALGHSNITMTNQYLASAEQSVKNAYAQLATHRARQQMKLVARS